ncbi:MAG: hypothetical protein RL757_2003 [Bacteroidota bacterium]|jgi:hypothetical protein
MNGIFSSKYPPQYFPIFYVFFEFLVRQKGVKFSTKVKNYSRNHKNFEKF